MSTLFEATIEEALQEIMDAHPDWTTINDLLEALDEQDVWGDYIERALVEAKKQLIRRCMRRLVDLEGNRTVASIARTDEDGNTVRVYKQETLFDVDDYRQHCAYHVDRGKHHFRVARKSASNCRQRYSVDPMPLFVDDED